MEIRALTKDDAEVFHEFRLEALDREPGAFGSSASEHRATSVPATAKRLAAATGDSFVLGAFSGGRLVGTAGFFRNQREKERHKGGVWGVYVNAEWRSKGVARALMTELLRRARAQPGLEQINLAVAVQQTAAKRLYESLGFEVFGHERHALKSGDVYIDEDHMVLWLG